MSDLIALSTTTYLNSSKSVLLFVAEGQEREQSLDNLELLVLTYLIEHQNKTVTKEQLLALWPTTVVMEHSLARVISSLRKKLNDSTKSPLFIKTVQREGYKYIGDNAVVVQPSNLENKLAKHKIGLVLGALLVSGLAYLSTVIFTNTGKPKSPNYVRQIIADRQTQKQDLSISPNGDFLAYSAQKVGSEHWFLRIKNTKTGATVDHTIVHNNIYVPTWLSNSSLLFQQATLDDCSYQLVALDNALKLTSTKYIADCNPNLGAKTIAALDDKNVLISDSIATDFPFSIYQIELSTGQKTIVKESEGLGNGVYKIITNPNTNVVATLETKDWFDTTITLYEKHDFERVVWRKTLKTPLYSIALDNHHVSYIDELGQLTSVNFHDDTQLNNHTIFTSKTYHPIAHQQNFYLFEGQYLANQSGTFNFKTGEEESLNQLLNDNIYAVKKIDDKRFVYVSDQSGMSQVWLANIDGTQVKQLTTFERSLAIKNIAFDIQNEILAIESQFGIIVYHKNDKDEFVEQRLIPDAQFPALNGEQVYITRQQHRGTSIFRYDIAKDELTLFIKGGYQLSIDKGQFYYSKYFQPGLWRFNPAERSHEEIAIPNKQLTLEIWDVQNGVLTVVDEGSVIQTNLDSLSVEHFDSTPCESALLWLPFTCLTHQQVPVANKIIKLKASE